MSRHQREGADTRQINGRAHHPPSERPSSSMNPLMMRGRQTETRRCGHTCCEHGVADQHPVFGAEGLWELVEVRGGLQQMSTKDTARHHEAVTIPEGDPVRRQVPITVIVMINISNGGAGSPYWLPPGSPRPLPFRGGKFASAEGRSQPAPG